MKAKFIFVSTILLVDAFFVSYYIGFNSRHVPVLDPKLPAYVPPATPPKEAKPVVEKEKTPPPVDKKDKSTAGTAKGKEKASDKGTSKKGGKTTASKSSAHKSTH